MSSDVFSFEDVGDITVATLQQSEITSKAGELLNRKMQSIRESHQPVKVVLDLSNVTFLGSIGLGIMVVLHKHAKECNGQMVIAGLRPQCQGVVSVTGLDAVFKQEGNVAAAVKILQTPLSTESEPN